MKLVALAILETTRPPAIEFLHRAQDHEGQDGRRACAEGTSALDLDQACLQLDERERFMMNPSRKVASRGKLALPC